MDLTFQAEPMAIESQSPKNERAIDTKYADETLRILQLHGDSVGSLTTEKEKTLRRKLYWRIFGLLSAINLLLFIDKSTLGYAAILGLFEETGITKAQYNNLGTFFYVGYIVAQWPGHYAMQKLPFGKFVAALVFMWGVILLLHCVATTYAALVVLRLALGAAESVVVPAMEVTIGMFFNRYEQSFLQPFLWLTSAAAPICAAFISYAEATFLSLEERIHTIKRVHESSQSSIEQKQFKKSQFRETLRDPISWLFTLQSFTLMMSNNLTYGQQNLITKALGVDSLGSTLVAAAGGGFGVLVCLAGAYALRWWPSNLAFHGLFWCIPAIAGGIGMVAIDWDQKLGMLACLLLAGHTYGNTYIIALGWTTSSAAGYTKKLTRNVMFMVGYSIANICSPQIWVPKGRTSLLRCLDFHDSGQLGGDTVDSFDYTVPVETEERKTHELGVVEELDETGSMIRREVEIAMLDLTDMENPFFVYPI
ncbi:hypothetical protein N7497_011905 [Penicillium chrysogenum]|nr:hypothetical protein N7497_011905 [Penicillium chrysogenum]